MYGSGARDTREGTPTSGGMRTYLIHREWPEGPNGTKLVTGLEQARATWGSDKEFAAPPRPVQNNVNSMI
jgi:hypothetical protein